MQEFRIKVQLLRVNFSALHYILAVADNCRSYDMIGSMNKRLINLLIESTKNSPKFCAQVLMSHCQTKLENVPLIVICTY